MVGENEALLFNFQKKRKKKVNFSWSEIWNLNFSDQILQDLAM